METRAPEEERQSGTDGELMEEEEEEFWLEEQSEQQEDAQNGEKKEDIALGMVADVLGSMVIP
jgi:hypothetical protein